MKLQPTCRHFSGQRPCQHDVCHDNCNHYESAGQQVLVVRPYHLGNIVKSTPVIAALRKAIPGCNITWAAAGEGGDLVRYHPHVKRVLDVGDPAAVAWAQQMRWNLVLSLDVDYRAAGLADSMTTDVMIGYSVNSNGTTGFVGSEFEYIYRLGIDDELRFKVNRIPLHELYFEMLGVPYDDEKYQVCLNPWGTYDAPVYQTASHLQGAVGLYIGGSSHFPSKQWQARNWATVAQIIHDSWRPVVLLGGGQRDANLGEFIQKEIGDRKIFMPSNSGLLPSLWEMGGLCCVVTTDGFRLHAAVSNGTPVVSLHGPTPAWEAPLFGKGEQIVAPGSVDCGPCYKHNEYECPHHCDGCMSSITPPMVMTAVNRVLGVM